MVRVDELPTDDKTPNVPNPSAIVIHPDRVMVYLFADSYRGWNGQVGYIEVQNVLIYDKRENPTLEKLKMVLADAHEAFNKELMDEETYDVAQFVIQKYNLFLHDIIEKYDTDFFEEFKQWKKVDNNEV